MRVNRSLMQILTITAARKNLGRLLRAAAQGKDIRIVSGPDIIALRKVGVESTDYVQREYGVTLEQVRRFSRAVGRRYRKLSQAGRVTFTTAEEIEKLLEKPARF